MQIRLRYKLFLVILLANALLTLVIVFANNRAFTASFDTYLVNVQARRLAPLLDSLAEEYQTRGSWDRIAANPDEWQRLTRRFLWPRHEHRHPASGAERRLRRSLPVQLRDANGQIVQGRPTATGRTSWIPIEIAGQRVGDLGIPMSLRLTSEFDRIFADQQRSQLRWIALAALLLAAALAVPFAGALVRPITRLQKAAQQLADGRYNIALPSDGSDELAELARHFNALAHTLEQNLEARQRWIADISHELRTPVAVLQAELEALQDGIAVPDQATLGSLHKEILRLGGLISDLHELSLSDAGALSYRKIPVDLGELIQDVCSHRQGALAKQHIGFDFQSPESPVIVQGDPDRLTQLLANLMQNSLNHTDGTPSKPGTLCVQLSQTEREIHLQWSDSAPGVPESALPRLFDRLYRVETSRNRLTGGSGLGLAIARNVVAAHGGRIEARPSRFGGLALEITFPRAEFSP